MAWNSRRRRPAAGPWAFVVQNPLLAVCFVLGLGLLVAMRSDNDFARQLRAMADDAAASVMEVAAGPAAEGRRWIEGAGTLLRLHDENQRLREENARLRLAQGELDELRRRVRRYEQLLKVPTDVPVEGVAGRVIADLSSPFLRTVLVNAGDALGVSRGQAVVDDRGLLGRIVGTGRRSARVLLLTDVNSRIPVIIEGADLKAILAGDNSDRPSLLYLPPGSRLTAGTRVLTTADGGALPPGIVVGTVVRGETGPRVQLFTSEWRADFVRVLQYTAPVDVDAPATEPGVTPGAPSTPVSPQAAGDGRPT